MKRCWGFGVALCLATQLLLAGSLEDRVNSQRSLTRGEESTVDARVREAALVTYIHGMTRAIAEREVGPAGVPYLLELLRDPDFERRDNVVALLAYLAYDGDAQVIADFLDDPSLRRGRPEDNRARFIVPEALGRIASRGGIVAKDILQQLRDDPDVEQPGVFDHRRRAERGAHPRRAGRARNGGRQQDAGTLRIGGH